MKRLLCLCVLGWGATACAADLARALRQVAVYEHGQDPSGVRELESAAARAAGTPDAAALERQVLSALAATGTLAGKDVLCRALALVGTDAAVPALAGMLSHAGTAEMARSALERITGQAATAALRTALPQSPAARKAGLAVSLGRRKDARSVARLTSLLSSSDAVLAAAAASALGDIGGNEALDALLAARPSADVTDALLRVAEKASRASAGTTYRRLAAAEYAEPVRIAALRGLTRVDATQAVPLLEVALKSDSHRLQAAGVRELASLNGASLARRIPELPLRVQVQAITALVDKGGPEALPALERALTSGHEAVRVAALNGIAKLGRPSLIPALARRAAAATGNEQAAARFALGSVRGENADAAVLTALGAAPPEVKVELIRAAGERGIANASDALLQTATDPNRAVRAASVRALRETAGAPQVPALVALLVRAEDENERTEYERTLAAAIRRAREAPVGEVVKAYQSASDPDLQASLLGVLAAVGNSDALPTLRAAVQSSNAEVQRAAVNALAAWPSPEPLGDLLTLARTSGSQGLQVLALRGYVKLVQLPSDRPLPETAKLLSVGMSAAKRPEERKAVIAAAQRVVTPESLALVSAAAAADPAVEAEARAAITVLERGLSYRSK